jgi:hypothetical protein
MHRPSLKAFASVFLALAFLAFAQAAEEPAVLCKVIERDTQAHSLTVNAALPAPFNKEGTAIRIIMDGKTVAQGKIKAFGKNTTTFDLDPKSVTAYPTIGKMVQVK